MIIARSSSVSSPKKARKKHDRKGNRVRRAQVTNRGFAILFAAALASISGAAACGGVQEEVQKQAEEEVEKGREQVEQEVQEGRTQIEQEVQEERTQIEEAVEGQ